MNMDGASRRQSAARRPFCVLINNICTHQRSALRAANGEILYEFRRPDMFMFSWLRANLFAFRPSEFQYRSAASAKRRQEEWQARLLWRLDAAAADLKLFILPVAAAELNLYCLLKTFSPALWSKVSTNKCKSSQRAKRRPHSISDQPRVLR
jgi:hypothetical protein